MVKPRYHFSSVNHINYYFILYEQKFDPSCQEKAMARKFYSNSQL
jgi:hypothetical protein